MFRQRLLSAMLFIPLVIAATWAGGYFFYFLILVASFLGLHELFKLGDVQHLHMTIFAYVGSMIILTITFFYGLLGLFIALICFFLAINIYWVCVFPCDFQHILLTFWGQFYITGMLAFFILLRNQTNGFLLVLSVLLSIWASDTGAYLCGITWGRHKLIPAVSPKKSVEGAVGGLLFAGVTLVLMAPYLHIPRVIALLIGFIFSFVGQFGDLVESALKRWANTKDSGNILPGHGGMLDRLDSLLFTVPAAYFIYTYLTGRLF